MKTPGALAALALAVAPPAAEDLYDKDGVQLWTSVRLVTRDAATCHVREDRHSHEEYQRLKTNQGQPLHVWRLDLTAANYSAKVIEYLRANVNVESEWPPCTNWDWKVQQDYPGGVDWAGGILMPAEGFRHALGRGGARDHVPPGFPRPGTRVRPLDDRLQLRGRRASRVGQRRSGRAPGLRCVP